MKLVLLRLLLRLSNLKRHLILKEAWEDNTPPFTATHFFPILALRIVASMARARGKLDIEIKNQVYGVTTIGEMFSDNEKNMIDLWLQGILKELPPQPEPRKYDTAPINP